MYVYMPHTSLAYIMYNVHDVYITESLPGVSMTEFSDPCVLRDRKEEGEIHHKSYTVHL